MERAKHAEKNEAFKECPPETKGCTFYYLKYFYILNPTGPKKGS